MVVEEYSWRLEDRLILWGELAAIPEGGRKTGRQFVMVFFHAKYVSSIIMFLLDYSTLLKR